MSSLWLLYTDCSGVLETTANVSTKFTLCDVVSKGHSAVYCNNIQSVFNQKSVECTELNNYCNG